jgi:hypothetical protein
MASPAEVAAWMVSQLEGKRGLYQARAVRKIRDKFGEMHVYLNANGNLAISKDVLKQFRCLTGGTVRWQRTDHCWLKRIKPLSCAKGHAQEAA